MSKIFKNQTKLILTFDTGQSLVGALSTTIKYIKPSGMKGSFNASINLDNLVYYVEENDLNEYGNWIFWCAVTFGDGSIGYGEPVRVTVYKEGEL